MWKPRKLPPEFHQTVDAIFKPMADLARPGFDDSDLQSLYSLVGLTVDFHIFLKTVNLQTPDEDDLDYACESIFWGIESFVEVNHSYKILDSSLASGVEWSIVSPVALAERFTRMYTDFSVEQVFERKCRLLLDMFKLQIAFAGMSFS